MRTVVAIAIVALALGSATASSWLFLRAARRWLTRDRFAWAQLPGALLIGVCVLTVIAFFGLDLLDVRAHWKPGYPRDEVDRAFRPLLLRGTIGFVLALPIGAAASLVTTAIQLGIDRFRAAWKTCLLLLAPIAVWIGSFFLLMRFRPAGFTVVD